MSASGAAAIIVNEPPCAPGNPPLTGESMICLPASITRAPISRPSRGLIVAVRIIAASSDSVSSAPSAPNRTASTCPPFITMIKTASAPSANAAGVSTALPPILTNAARRSSDKSKPATSKPAFNRFFASPDPISPSPITPTFVMDNLLLIM